MKYHVILDENDEVIAWTEATEASPGKPSVAIAPIVATHTLHTNVEADVGAGDVATVASELSRAVAGRSPREG